MPQEMYWVDVEADRTGCEVAINGIPAERLTGTHGLRFPVNEYLVEGINRIELRRGPWRSNKPDDEGGSAKLRVIRARFDGTTKLAEDTLAEREASYAACTPGQALLDASLESARSSLPSLVGFDPIGPREQAAILDQLAAVAAMWQRGEGDAIATWMREYIAQYVAAYPLESVRTMEQRVMRMATAFRSGTVRFDRPATRLDPVPGKPLVDCLSPGGAALRIERGNAPAYDMWAVVGCRGGQVVLVR